MASADPAVTASPSSHVGIANVRRDATRQTRDCPKSSFKDFSGYIPLGKTLSHLEDVDGEAFQVSLSVSSSKPPTHLFFCLKSLIGRRFSDQRRKHPLYLHGHPLSHDENFERSSPVSLLIYFPCTRKHIYTSRDKRGVDEQRDSFHRTSDSALISLDGPRKE